MKMPVAVAVFFVSLLASGCSGEAQQMSSVNGTCQLAEEDITWIRAMEARHQAEALTADFDAMSEAFSDTVVIMPPNQADIIGRTALREWQTQFPPMEEYDLSIEEIVGCGDLAYVRGTYSLAFTPIGASERIADSGRWMHILRKQPDGTWTITRDFFSSTQPLAQP